MSLSIGADTYEMDYNYMTKEGLEKLMEEITRLESQERPKIAQMIAEARDKGDLSENAEYDAAREAMAMLEAQISQLKTTATKARIVDSKQVDTEKVQLLTTVRLEDIDKHNEVTYSIVPDLEANFKEHKISINAPIAKGLIGKKVGEVAEIEVPIGKLRLKVLEIKSSLEA